MDTFQGVSLCQLRQVITAITVSISALKSKNRASDTHPRSLAGSNPMSESRRKTHVCLKKPAKMRVSAMKPHQQATNSGAIETQIPSHSSVALMRVRAFVPSLGKPVNHDSAAQRPVCIDESGAEMPALLWFRLDGADAWRFRRSRKTGT